MKNNNKIINENDFKVKQLTEWNIKKYTLDEDRVDIKLHYIWLETKQKSEDIYEMLSQVIFTAYKVMSNKPLPTHFGCFNSKVGAIIENSQAQEVFRHTDIDWTQTPSKIDKKTVERIKFLLNKSGGYKEYNLEQFGKILKEIEAKGSLEKQAIDKNNFIEVYQEWLNAIGNNIDNDFLKENEIPKADCYLADLMTDGKRSLAEKLHVILNKNYDNFVYEKITNSKFGSFAQKIQIKDQQAYLNFWNKYHRPPAEEYQQYILERRDLLQPHNIREIKGAFFTPKVWSIKSKEYIAEAFGTNWQDEYYIWDCACGTGNLLQGLVNQDRIFMSTLDEEDISIMKQLDFMPNAIKFQFDFLNDEFKPRAEGGKLADKLYKIIKEEPEKLIIYINPPYAENGGHMQRTGKKKVGVSFTKVQELMKTQDKLGKASNELFIQFYYRIYKEIKACKLCSFSTLKNCISPNFDAFRNFFNAKFCGGFVCEANTFDNVKGAFPISFQMWDLGKKEEFKKELNFDILEAIKPPTKNEEILKAQKVGVKKIYNLSNNETINSWFKKDGYSKKINILGYVSTNANDFQHCTDMALYPESFKPKTNGYPIDKENLTDALIYTAVRLCIPATWLNDRDQFAAPKKIAGMQNLVQDYLYSEGQLQTKNNKIYTYEEDETFINNCIVFALFEKNYTNWQIFPNNDIGINGIERDMTIYNLLLKNKVFGEEAEAVLNASKQIYKLAMEEFNNPHASWNEVNKQLKESKNIKYIELRQNFKKAQKTLAMEVAEGVYKHGFLK